MKTKTGLVALTLALGWVATADVRAENVKGRWHLGGGFSFVSTEDDIRSNAAFVRFQNPGIDGIPDSGDEVITFVDPRPDDLLSRETTIEEDFKLDFNASYGVNDWFSVRLDVSYFEADVVQLDTFRTENFPVDFGDPGDNIIQVNETANLQQSQPITGGTLTQIPIGLTGVFRFRRDSPLNPYIGAGVGYILTDIEHSQQVDARNMLMENARIRSFIRDDEGVADFPDWDGLTLTVEDSFEYHVTAGAEYFFNSNLSMYFDARYMFADENVVISVSGNEQITIAFDSERDTLPFCTEPQFDDPDLNTRGFGNRSGTVDGNDFGGAISPKSQGIDGVCRPGTGTRTADTLLIQGGDINLSAFEIGIGLRWYF